MTQHNMKLNPAPFGMIQQGVKTVEARLYDEKRQQVALGDEIEFTPTDGSSRPLATKVVGLLRYHSFADMYQHNDPVKFGGTSATELTDGIRKYYSLEDEQRYGVVGIEIELI